MSVDSDIREMSAGKAVGCVLDSLSMPCLTTPAMWIRCAINSADIRLYWTLTTPDPKAWIHIGTGKSWMKHFKTLLKDVNEERATEMDASLGAMFEVGEWADKLSWWWFLAGIGADFLANWTSAVRKQAGCLPDNQSQILLDAYEPQGGCFPGQPWANIGPWHAEPNNNGPLTGDLTIPKGWFGAFNMSVTPYVILGDPFAVDVRCVDTLTGMPLCQRSYTASDVANGNTMMSMSGRIASGIREVHLAMQIRASGPNKLGQGEIYWDHGRLHGYANPY